MMRVLLLNDEVEADITRVVDYAEAHPVSYAALLRMMELQEPPVGDDPQHCVIVPDQFRCVFSIEEQRVGRMRHLSVSVPGEGRYPSRAAMGLLMALFGFSDTFSLAVGEGRPPSGVINVVGAIWLERGIAVNVVELMETAEAR